MTFLLLISVTDKHKVCSVPLKIDLTVFHLNARMKNLNQFAVNVLMSLGYGIC